MKSDFNFDRDIVLENDVVLLRPLALSDFDNLLEFSVNEPELWKYSLIPAEGAENFSNYIKVAIEGRKEKKQYPFIVYDKIKKKYVGCTRFYEIDFANESLYIGYTWYGKDFQGTGLNKNCKLLLLDYAFENMGIFRVEFRADNNNEKSVAAMKGIGCTVEGILRKENLLYTGYRRDTIILSILKPEWLESLREKLVSKIK